MLISHKNNFVTIDIPKTGTRSLRQSLEPLGVVDITGSPTGEFKQHGDIRSCEQAFKRNNWDLDKYLKFSVVRNPWKRYVSYLNYYFDDINDLKKKTPESKDWSDERTQQAYKQTDIFNSLNGCKTSYLEYIINSKDSQDFYILDSNGCLAVDFLGKTESLNKYFNLFCKRVGIKESAELVIGNKSKYYRDYKDYYSEELVKIVEDKEEWVLSNFDYKFE
jgi:hypothetical protein